MRGAQRLSLFKRFGKEKQFSWVLSARLWLYRLHFFKYFCESLLEFPAETSVPELADETTSGFEHLVCEVQQSEAHGDHSLVVHLTETRGVGRHVTEDDISKATRQEPLKLSVGGGASDVLIGQKACAIKRGNVQEVDPDDSTTGMIRTCNRQRKWHLILMGNWYYRRMTPS